MESHAINYVKRAWRVGPQVSEWQRIDMAWFSKVRLVSSLHHTRRAIEDARDPALGCRRIQSPDGHHSKFGPPFICCLERDRVAVAAHDVAFIAKIKKRGLIMITTLPKKEGVSTFNSFIKPRKTAQHWRRQRSHRPKKGTNVNKK